MPRRRRTTLITIGLLLSTLAACSGGSGSGTESTRSPYEDLDDASDLGPRCSGGVGNGYSEAARYSGEGPHRAAVFLGAHETEDSGGYPVMLPDLDAGAVPVGRSTPASSVALLICGEGERGEESVGSCSYIGLSGSLPMRSQEYVYTVYELRTGRVVDTIREDSRAQDCPDDIGYDFEDQEDNPDFVYAQMSDFEVADVLEDVITGPAR
ncbi:hypothetical protein SAMN04487904_113151 [Actinopolyspora lacussalsi subsp. righensis]|uniref:Secreted protein n=1 Tax=Actinopolyspora righensis TaxID=995060 RepID=A0A1I7C0N4_9ACTN|nr:hypothetical protein SAMN04487904_113151 [Actinopolyspora righensis]